MTIQATITGGKNVARDIEALIEQEAEESLRDKYREFALDLFELSPIYPSAKYSTGAYISSHGVQFNSTSVPGGGIKYLPFSINQYNLPTGTTICSSRVNSLMYLLYIMSPGSSNHVGLRLVK